jgi:hypothetical protein
VLIVIILVADFGLRFLDVVLPRLSVMFSTVIPWAAGGGLSHEAIAGLPCVTRSAP